MNGYFLLSSSCLTTPNSYWKNFSNFSLLFCLSQTGWFSHHFYPAIFRQVCKRHGGVVPACISVHIAIFWSFQHDARLPPSPLPQRKNKYHADSLCISFINSTLLLLRWHIVKDTHEIWLCQLSQPNVFLCWGGGDICHWPSDQAVIGLDEMFNVDSLFHCLT